MNINTLANLVVIACLMVVIFLIFKNMQAKRKILAGDTRTESAAKKWMKENGFVPDHAHFFRGTGIAMRTGDDKLVLVIEGMPGFHQAGEVISVHTQETVVTRMVGAAPGIVKPVGTTVYNMDMAFKNGSPTCTVSFINEEQRKAWVARLRNTLAPKEEKNGQQA